MENNESIKRSYLIVSFLLIAIVSPLLSGILINNSLQQSSAYEEMLQQHLADDRQHVAKTYVDDIIRGIETDYNFCSDNGRGRVTTGRDTSSSLSCEPSFLEGMVKTRIEKMVLPEGLILKVIKVLEYSGGRNYTRLLVDSSAIGGEEKVLRTEKESKDSDNREIEDLAQLKEAGFLQKQRDNPLNPTLFKYSRLDSRFDWIVSAETVLHSPVIPVAWENAPARQNKWHTSIVTLILLLCLISAAVVAAWYVSVQTGARMERMRLGQEKEKKELLARSVDMEQRLAEKSRHLFTCESNLATLRRAADTIGVVIVALRNGRAVVEDISPGIVKMLGVEGDEIIDNDYLLLHPPETAEEIRKMTERIKLYGKGFSGERVLLKKEGIRLPVLYSCQPRYDSQGNCNGIIIVAVDISKLYETRKALHISEERLQQALKLEAIGTLAGGIAHDFNNVLSSIVGYSELVKEQLSPGSQARNDLEQVLHASSRAANLVKQILAFSRNNTTENSYFEPALIVKETLKMLRSTIPATIEIRNRIHAEGQTIFANTTQFHQVFMNLCTNAFQSMETSGGVLTVDLNKVNDLGHVPGDVEICGDEFLELVVSDTGCGIAKEIKEKVFQPFFSTKDSAKGTGMGLHTVYNIVTKIGGAIWFNDRAEGGTEFHVLLPAAQARQIKNRKEGKSGPIPQGAERILLVDDEEDITKMAKAMLEGLGYTVDSFNSGLEALQLFLEDPELFDLIITDQTMPEITGAELAQKVRQHSSDIPIILCTGYSARISDENWMRHGVSAFIMKPYRKIEIARLIRETLDAKSV